MVFNPRAGEPADDSVSTAKLQDNAVTLAKAADALKRDHIEASDVDYNHVGTTRKQFELVQFSKNTQQNTQTLEVVFEASVADANAADVELWINSPNGDWDANDEYTGAGSPDETLNITTTTAGDLHTITYDASGLANGNHTARFVIQGDAAGSDLTSVSREWFSTAG